MAALQPALQPAFSGSAYSLGQDAGAQQIGTEGRDATDIGIPYSDPNWGQGPLLQAPAFANASIESTGLDYLGTDYQGSYPDHTPWPSSQGDPDYAPNATRVDRTGDTTNYDATYSAQFGHDWDQGNPAAIRWYGNPDIGKPDLREFTTQSTERQPIYDDIGYMQEPIGTRTAPSLDWQNDANINVGIGYYVQETERPFYNQIAEVPGEYSGPGGQDQPDNRYSSWIYNDGGIPNSFTTPPDPPVNPAPSQAAYVSDDIGYGGNY